MSDEDEEIVDSLNDTTEEVDNTEEVEDTVVDTETKDTTPEYTEAEQKAYARMKKAEAEAKELKAKLKAQEAKPKPSQKQDGITAMDAMVLMGAKVTVQEDIQEVVDYANYKNISVAEALQTSAIKSILAERAEQRTTAEATNTGSARRGTSLPSPETILANAEKGKLPENPEDLAEARWAAKSKK